MDARSRRRASLPALVFTLALVGAACGGGSDGAAPDRRAATAPDETTVGTGGSATPTTALTPSTTAGGPAPVPTTAPSTAGAAPGGTPSTTAPQTATPQTATPPTTVGSVPTAVAVPRCTSSVIVGPFVVRSRSGCFTRTGLVWETTGPADVSGLRADPVGGGRLVVDPVNVRVASTGYRWTAGGDAAAGELQLDLGSEPVDWAFQYPIVAASARSALPAATVEARLAAIARQPGLASVRTLPQVSRGVPDLRALDEAAVAEFVAANPTAGEDPAVFPLGAVGLTGLGSLELVLPKTFVNSALGLRMAATLRLTPTARDGVGGFDLGAAVELPDLLRGFEGSATLFVGVDGEVRVRQAAVLLPQVTAGAVTLRPVDLAFDERTGEWSGRVGAYLGVTRNAPGLDATLRIREGRLQRIGVTVGGLPVPLGPAATLYALGGALEPDPLLIQGDATVRLGPSVPIVGGIDLTGSVRVDASRTSATGTFSVAGRRVGQVVVAYDYGEQASLDGTVALALDPAGEVGLTGRMTGVVTADAFAFGGAVQVGLWDLGRVAGDATLTETGVAACGEIRVLGFDAWRLGIGYLWSGNRIDLLGATCNSRTYLLDARAAANPAPTPTSTAPRQAAGTGTAAGVRVAARTQVSATTVTVPERAAVLSVLLNGPVAGSRLVAPDGRTIDVASLGAPSADRRVGAVRSPDGTQVVVVVAEPDPGRWEIRPAGPSVTATAQVTLSGFRPIEPTEPVAADAVTTRPDGLIVAPALAPAVADGVADAAGGADRAAPRAERETDRRSAPAGRRADGAGDARGSDDPDGLPWTAIGVVAAGLVVLVALVLALAVIRRRSGASALDGDPERDPDPDPDPEA